jgi:hypothetical protein
MDIYFEDHGGVNVETWPVRMQMSSSKRLSAASAGVTALVGIINAGESSSPVDICRCIFVLFSTISLKNM